MYLFGICEFLAIIVVLLQSKHVLADEPARPPAAPRGPTISEWFGFGGNIYNNRWNYQNTLMDSNSLMNEGLKTNCKVDFMNGLTVPPAVDGQIAYFPTSNGSYYAYNYFTCQVIWQVNVTAITYNFATPSPYATKWADGISRTAPAIDPNNGVLYFGTLLNALLVAIDIKSGTVLGVTQVNNHPVAICTQSPSWFDGAIFIGTSSFEEYSSSIDGYKCCSFIGNFKAYIFTHDTGFEQLWEFQSLPSGQGWSGGGIWGSQPSIDPDLELVFIGTGDAYTFDENYKDCLTQGESCLPAGVYIDSVVALKISDGQPLWNYAVSGLDTWVYACDAGPSSNCQDGYYSGADADFGMAPTFIPGAANPTGMNLVVVGQKNGNMYCFTNVGYLLWTSKLGTSSSATWLNWGIASDGNQVYYTLSNQFGASLTSTNGVTFNNSAWGALNISNGDVVWEIPVPGGKITNTPPIVVNDLIWVSAPSSSSTSDDGAVYALSKNTGYEVYSVPFQGSQPGGVMITSGFLMFGTGAPKSGSVYSLYVLGLPSVIQSSSNGINNKQLDPPTSSSSSSMSMSTSILIPSKILSKITTSITLTSSKSTSTTFTSSFSVASPLPLSSSQSLTSHSPTSSSSSLTSSSPTSSPSSVTTSLPSPLLSGFSDTKYTGPQSNNSISLRPFTILMGLVFLVSCIYIDTM